MAFHGASTVDSPNHRSMDEYPPEEDPLLVPLIVLAGLGNVELDIAQKNKAGKDRAGGAYLCEIL